MKKLSLIENELVIIHEALAIIRISLNTKSNLKLKNLNNTYILYKVYMCQFVTFKDKDNFVFSNQKILDIQVSKS